MSAIFFGKNWQTLRHYVIFLGVLGEISTLCFSNEKRGVSHKSSFRIINCPPEAPKDGKKAHFLFLDSQILLIHLISALACFKDSFTMHLFLALSSPLHSMRQDSPLHPSFWNLSLQHPLCIPMNGHS